jgi:hypothetical protein
MKKLTHELLQLSKRKPQVYFSYRHPVRREVVEVLKEQPVDKASPIRWREIILAGMKDVEGIL